MELHRKGIILAGGYGTRLAPLTSAISKQLMPIYDKPMIYYPLSTLMLSGLRDILLITNPNDKNIFYSLLGDGSKWGINISYTIQYKPEGLAQAFLIGEKFLSNSKCCLILGDNLFYGSQLTQKLNKVASNKLGSTIFAYSVKDPERYGLVSFDKNGKAINLDEKPNNPKTKYAVPGLYFYDETVVERAKKIKKSDRGEYEITTLNQMYLNDGLLQVEILGRGVAWLDTGTFDSLNDASTFIRTLENRQGLKVGCPEEIAWRNGWIDDNQLEKLAQPLLKSTYGDYLLDILSKSLMTH